jgi:hypothetical protein
MKNKPSVFWNVKPRSLVEVHRCFGSTFARCRLIFGGYLLGLPFNPDSEIRTHLPNLGELQGHISEHSTPHNQSCEELNTGCPTVPITKCNCTLFCVELQTVTFIRRTAWLVQIHKPSVRIISHSSYYWFGIPNAPLQVYSCSSSCIQK